MLVLSRKVNEVIMIGEIAITLVGIHNGRVRLGIDAPEHVPVHRKEVYDTIKAGEATADGSAR